MLSAPPCELSLEREGSGWSGAGAGDMQITEHECQPQVPEDVMNFMVPFVDQLTQLDSAPISNNTAQQRERCNFSACQGFYALPPLFITKTLQCKLLYP